MSGICEELYNNSKHPILLPGVVLGERAWLWQVFRNGIEHMLTVHQLQMPTGGTA
jgi:hypothetical protein